MLIPCDIKFNKQFTMYWYFTVLYFVQRNYVCTKWRLYCNEFLTVRVFIRSISFLIFIHFHYIRVKLYFWSHRQSHTLKCSIRCLLLLTFLPRDCRQMTTEFRFCRSHKSTVWKVSWGGTPRILAASRKTLMFSMHLNAIVLWLIFFADPGLMQFTNLKSHFIQLTSHVVWWYSKMTV